MSIQELYTNIKQFFKNPDTLTVFIVILMGMSSFWLGRLSAGNESQSSTPFADIENQARIQATSPSFSVAASESNPQPTLEPIPLQTEESGEGSYVASKSGTKYHLPWCGSAKQIKDSNKIWFQSKAEAEAAGYTPAANCKGI